MKTHPHLKPHIQVPCKVTALVDEGIKDLVELLNTFDGVRTTDSCQGRKGELAFVNIDYGEEFCKKYDDGETFDKLAHFAVRLAKSFADHTKSVGFNGHYAHISIVWAGDKRFPDISLTMPPSCIPDVTRILSLVHAEFEGSRDGTHTGGHLGRKNA